MSQMLLFPDPRPLVERLGAAFFRQAPEGPGVYIMRDASDHAIYVGKAKNLRKRLCCYRVANPDRLPKRHLRMLRMVRRIELNGCGDEAQALRLEAELLLRLRPKFNRAGTWPRPREWMSWRVDGDQLLLAATASSEAGWSFYGPIPAAKRFRAAIARLSWLILNATQEVDRLPHGWVHGHFPTLVAVPLNRARTGAAAELLGALEALRDGNAEPLYRLAELIGARVQSIFRAILDQDVEELRRMASRLAPAVCQPEEKTNTRVELEQPTLLTSPNAV